jgi:hypothetical protein
MGIGVQIMYGIPGCTTIPSYQWTQVFWRHMLPPFSSLGPEDLGSMLPQNTGRHWQYNTMSWPRPESDWVYSVLHKHTNFKEILKIGTKLTSFPVQS